MEEPVPSIAHLLLAEFAHRFPDRTFRADAPPQPVATFPAAHPDVGEVSVWDDGGEATVAVGDITHGHFDCYDEGLSAIDRRRRVANDVAKFLELLFSDRVLLWHSPGPNPRSGGWQVIDASSSYSIMDGGDVTYLWSGPTPNKLGGDQS